MSTEEMIGRIYDFALNGGDCSCEFIDREDGALVTIKRIEAQGGIVRIYYTAFPDGDSGSFRLNDCYYGYVFDIYNAVFGKKRDKNLFQS